MKTFRKTSTGCWEWKGRTNKEGYAIVSLRDADHLAHRVMWSLFHGVSKGKYVLHKCDNPLCVNPKHLFEGTQTDNMRDMVKKNRHYLQVDPSKSQGSRNNSAKLTEENVSEIRSLLSEGMSQRKIGIIFGVSQSTVSLIALGTRWRHVCEPVREVEG